MSLPPHQLLVNAIGDADLCRRALQTSVDIAAKTTAIVINGPAAVLHTGRVENAERLARIPGVITPRTLLLPRELLEDVGAPSLLARQKLTFPLLLRPPGYHTGRFFIRVENRDELAAALPGMPGRELLTMQYMDARNVDGKVRKYRVMLIDGRIFPLHAAISRAWKVHYFTAEMADSAEHRAEDAAFLAHMPEVVGPRAMQALEGIRRALALDYAGVDFSLGPSGDVILFEANATMVVHPPDKDARWDYRRPAVRRILDAIRDMLTKQEPP
jgi:glutathione synthase/RimK-type ligase-like ATP-grasp enzyme